MSCLSQMDSKLPQVGEGPLICGMFDYQLKANEQCTRDCSSSCDVFVAKVAEVRKKRLAHLIGLGPRFSNASLEGALSQCEEASQVMKELKRYADNFDTIKQKGTSLVLFGPYGTGKTYWASGLLLRTSRLESNTSSGKYTTQAEINRNIKGSWGKASTSEVAVVDSYVNPELLVVDEVGAALRSQADQSYLIEIIDLRYQACKPTILITNLSIEALGQLIGPRSIDRLRDNGGRVFEFNWPSYRG